MTLLSSDTGSIRCVNSGRETRRSPRSVRNGRFGPPRFVRNVGLAAVLILTLFLLQSFAAAVPAGSPSAPASAASQSASASNASVPLPGSSAGPSSLPGQNPANEPPANPSVLEHPILPGNNQTVLPANPSTPPTAAPLPAAPAAPAPAASSAPPNATRSAPGLTVPSGYIVGTVVDSRPPYDPISGATVTANPLAGFCPTTGCVPVATNALGQFKVTAATGENVIQVSDAYYMSNLTWGYVTTGGITDVGTIELVHDGFVTGTVRADDPAHQPLPGIKVEGLSRDGTTQALPITHTDSNGRFTVAVPPIPSQVEYTPIFQFSPYQGNYSFVNVAPGQTVNVGTVYLEKLTTVSIEAYDSVTHQPISAPGTIQVTSELTGYAPAQGSSVAGPIFTAAAPPGPDTVEVWAQGYVIDETSLGVVPITNPGAAPVLMRSVSLVPLGQVDVNVSVMGGIHSPGANNWGIGQAIITSCSLDGEQTGTLNPLTLNFSSSSCTGGCDPYVGYAVSFAAIPLRNYIRIDPDTAGACGFFGQPTWPIPGMLPVFENYAWANVTPDKAVSAGHIDLLPGTYVQGEVLPESSTGWDVIACSTDEPALCAPNGYPISEYATTTGNYPPAGCPGIYSSVAAYTFCTAVPFGPIKLQVTAGNMSGNMTWLYAPPFDYSQMPLSMSQTSELGVSSLNLTFGVVTGRVLQARSLTTVGGLPAVQVCPAGQSGSGTVCGSGTANATGFFEVNAPLGWDSVTVAAPNYQANTTWVDVVHKVSAGSILLTPYGYINGRVVDTHGYGITEAVVSACPAATPTACGTLGANGGQTSTNGAYFGAEPAGTLPEGTYRIVATAPGYESDWTWVNVTTPGENFTAPDIVLSPLIGTGGANGTAGVAVPRAAGGGATSNSSVGGWVAGRVVDAQNGLGLTTASLSAQPSTGGPPTVLGSVRGTGGEFNDTLPLGLYTLNITEPGFYPTSLSFDVTGAQVTVPLGTISLTPYPRLTGRVVIDPWRGLTLNESLGPTPASVSVCTETGSACSTGSADASGYFNISAPAGIYDLVTVSATGGGTGSSAGGFVGNQTSLNVTNATGATGGPLVIGLSVFGTVTGSVVGDTTAGKGPVRFDSVTVSATRPKGYTQGETLNATGQYTLFVPPGQILNVTAGGLGAWVAQGQSFSVNDSLNSTQPLLLKPGGVVNLDNLSKGPSFDLVHFGWIDARIVDASSGAPIPFATASGSTPGVLWGLPTSLTASGTANGDGFLNMTAPPTMAGENLTLTVSAADFTSSLFNATVNTSATTYLNGSSLATMPDVGLRGWGWVVGSVLDSVTGVGVPGATPVATSITGASGITSGVTNGAGAFRVDAPPSLSDHFTVTRVAYVSNSSYLSVPLGATVIDPTVHLVGYGAVAGRVVSFPDLQPVPGATVSACPRSQPTCTNTITTNATGYFLLEAPPGSDVIEVSATDYVSSNPAYVTVTSGQWVWGGTLQVYQFAYVTGTALGLPGGAPLAGANASLCSVPTSGTGAGPCFTTAVTASDGTFTVKGPAGLYVLDLNATFYNDTYLSVAISPGETLPVGTLFLQEYGTATGRVLSADAQRPILGTSVSACENWGAENCLPTLGATAQGDFVFSGPSGPYLVRASAPGYQSAYLKAELVSGQTVDLGNLSLVPIGPGNHYVVSGNVAVADASHSALPNAIVRATGGFTATTNASGGFSFVLPWGTYDLVVSESGYVTTNQTVQVYGTISGLRFALPEMTYSVSGVVSNGLSGVGVVNATFQNSQGMPIGPNSTVGGSYVLDLPNGTWTVRVGPPASEPSLAPSQFTVSVNGRSQSHAVSLFPYAETLDVLVADSLTGVAIPGASLNLSGSTSAGITWSFQASVGPNGRLTVPVYPGNYTLRSGAAGYVPARLSLSVLYSANRSSEAVSVALEPVSAVPASTGPSSGGLTWVVVGVGGGVAVAAVLYVFGRYRAANPGSDGRSRPPVRAA